MVKIESAEGDIAKVFERACEPLYNIPNKEREMMMQLGGAHKFKKALFSKADGWWDVLSRFKIKKIVSEDKLVALLVETSIASTIKEGKEILSKLDGKKIEFSPFNIQRYSSLDQVIEKLCLNFDKIITEDGNIKYRVQIYQDGMPY